MQPMQRNGGNLLTSVSRRNKTVCRRRRSKLGPTDDQSEDGTGQGSALKAGETGECCDAICKIGNEELVWKVGDMGWICESGASHYSKGTATSTLSLGPETLL